jgi:SAM-dependent methyltransferase
MSAESMKRQKLAQFILWRELRALSKAAQKRIWPSRGVPNDPRSGNFSASFS